MPSISREKLAPSTWNHMARRAAFHATRVGPNRCETRNESATARHRFHSMRVGPACAATRKRSTRHAGGRQRGAAVVEFAMVLVPLLLILLGTIDWGYYLYVRAIVTDAARVGARAGSLDPANAQATAIGAATAFLSNAGITGAEVTPSNGPPNSVGVQIVLATPSLTGFTGLADSDILPRTASAQATMRLEP